MKNFSLSFFSRKLLYPSVILLILMTLLTGLAYPLLITGIAQTVFPDKANGSLIGQDGKFVGSRLIGQNFSKPGYFWGRPSATSPRPYNAEASSGSNLGPTNPQLVDNVKERIAQLKKADPDNNLPVPVNLVTSSGSGLDPHISKASAVYQIKRVARARHMTEEQVSDLVTKYTIPMRFHFFGEEKVNVLELNLALDKMEANNTYNKGV